MARVAIIGLGGAAENIHLPACALLPDVELIGGSDPDPARREKLGRRFGIRALDADPAALIERERPEVVIVATPPDSHRDLCLLALRNGAHVLCEKPFARTVEEADEVIEAADRRRLSVIVNNQYRFAEIYRVAREQIASGRYGNAFLIQCWQQMFHPPSMEENWHAQLVQSTLFEFGTHALDLLCYFFDALPQSINAHIPRVSREQAADVVVQATLRFPGERLATLCFNRVSHGAERYLEMRVDCERASLRISFGGLARLSAAWSRRLRRPTLRASLVRGGEARVEAHGRSRVIAREWKDFRPRATAACLRGLLDAAASGGGSNDQARHARELLRTVFAGYESARTGETVWLQRSES